MLDERIRLLQGLRDELSSCIGCGCLSLDGCRPPLGRQVRRHYRRVTADGAGKSTGWVMVGITITAVYWPGGSGGSWEGGSVVPTQKGLAGVAENPMSG